MLRKHIITKLQEGLLKRVTTCHWFQTTEIWTSKCKTMNLVLAFLYAIMYIFPSTNLEHRSWSFQPFWVEGSWLKEDSLHWRTVRVLFWDILDLLTSRLWEYASLTQFPLLFLLLEQPVIKREGQKLRDKLIGAVKMLVGIFGYLLYNTYSSRLDLNLWSNVTTMAQCFKGKYQCCSQD